MLSMNKNLQVFKWDKAIRDKKKYHPCASYIICRAQCKMKMHSLLWECVQESGVGGRANLPFSKDLLSHSLRDSILLVRMSCMLCVPGLGVEARVPPCHLRDRWVHGPCTCLPGCSSLALHAIHSVLDPYPSLLSQHALTPRTPPRPEAMAAKCKHGSAMATQSPL